MNSEALRPYSQALLDYYLGDKTAAFTIIRDDGFESVSPAVAFYRKADEFETEKIALGLCRGKVLDAGAGTGIHSLYLQERGFRVMAIDISEEAVRIMKERGVKDVNLADIFNIKGSCYDTVLMMAHGIGMVEDMNGLGRFLSHLHLILSPGGQVLLTSVDVRQSHNPEDLAYHRRNIESGRYFGEVRMRFRYKNMAGPWGGWFHLDYSTLKEQCKTAGRRCDLLNQQADGNYLARICREEAKDGSQA